MVELKFHVFGLMSELIRAAKRIRLDELLAAAHEGNPSKLGTPARLVSHDARLAKNICALGKISGSPSRLPAGITSIPSVAHGTAEPQLVQKLLV